MRNIIMLKILTILLLFVMSSNVYATTFLVFPVKRVSKLNCKKQDFDTMSDDCKQNLPVLKTKYYKTKKNNSTYRNYYSVLWWATYKDGWDQWQWSHLWLDIASAKNTPIYAMYSWKIVVAGYKYGRGNIVSIEHKINGKQVFSNYAHMTKILVKVGQKIKAWKEIWKMWSTWASTWNHLHFQIDISNKTRHPYRYAECSWKYNVVNRGLCRDGLLSNTIDPILFIESNWTVFKNKIISKKIISKTKKENIIKKSDNIETKTKNKIVKKEVSRITKKTVKADNITRKAVKIPLSEKEKRRKETRKFKSKYEVEILTKDYKRRLALGETRKIYFKVKARNYKKYFSWKTPVDVIIMDSKRKVEFTKDRFEKIWKSQYFEIKGKKKGKAKIYVKLWSSVIEKFEINIYDKDERAKVKKAQLITKDKFTIGSTEIWWLIMKGTKGKKLVKIPYEGKYKLSSNWNIEFCQFGKCKAWFKKEIIFEYKDTINWILLFKYNTKKIWRWKIQIKRIDKNKTLIAKYVRWVKPKDLTKSNLYYNEIIWLIEEWILEVNKWYFWNKKNLTDVEAKKWIEKALLKMKKDEINTKIIWKIDEKLELLKSEKNSRKILTRKELLEKINKFLVINKENSKISLNFEDLNEQENKLANMIFDKRNTFKERNSRKFYKPEAKINKSEWAYMIKRAISVNKDFLVTLR